MGKPAAREAGGLACVAATVPSRTNPPLEEASEALMSDQALERSVLERKERDELHTIAEALGVKPGTRTKKADLIQTILVAAGVEPAPAPGDVAEKPKRAPRATKAAKA